MPGAGPAVHHHCRGDPDDHGARRRPSACAPGPWHGRQRRCATRSTAIEPAYAAVYFADLGPATITVTNAGRTRRRRLTRSPTTPTAAGCVGTARTLWTLEAVQQAVLDVDGVLDVLISDPLGGVDVSQSYFGAVRLRAAAVRRRAPLRRAVPFDVVVAHEFRWPWETTGAVPGVIDRVRAALDLVRPPGVHPNVIEADHIDVGVRARIVVQPGLRHATRCWPGSSQRVGAEATAACDWAATCSSRR